MTNFIRHYFDRRYGSKDHQTNPFNKHRGFHISLKLSNYLNRDEV